MASARKKLDDKNLKILRELLNRPENKHCFDCGQRGPTYVNVTIGSFVCTTCSGMLRGLTPPHRVKSITMATFTPEEIEFITNHGNEYCRKVWLGLADANTLATAGTEESHVRDAMIAKYERKRYYVKPSEVSRTNSNSLENRAIQPPPAIPKLPPANTTLSLNLNNTANAALFDNNNLVKSTKDPFGSMGFTPESETGFANFDNNPAFDSPPFQHTQNASHTNGPTVPAPSEDRYAALKDLDSLMKSQMASPDSSASTSVASSSPAHSWSSPSSNHNASNNWTPLFDKPTEQTYFNPFNGAGVENGWNTIKSEPVHFTPSNPSNPFKTDISWMTNNNVQMNHRNPWNNPFAVNGNGHSASSAEGHFSSNPFL